MDGNGRVARLMWHAMVLDALDTGAVWSVARGLARSVQQYKALLSNCDAPRRASTKSVSWRPWCSRIACALAFYYGRKRKSGWTTYLPGRAAFWKPCCPGENCLAATPTL
jgi:hypothetical protein